MTFTVIAPFADAQDSNHVYIAGDSYPRDGYTPTRERLEALTSSDNARGYALIKWIEKPVRKAATRRTKG